MVAQANPLEWEDGFQAEIDELKHNQFSLFLIPIPLIALFWLTYVISLPSGLALNAAPAFVLWGGTWAAYALRERRRLAHWLLLLSLIVADSLIVAAHPTSLALACGVLVVVMANALLGPWQAAVAGATMWLAGTAARQLGLGIPGLHWGTVDVLILYALTWGASLLAARPLKRSVQSTYAGWSRARQALEEARSRRAELYRVVRALEEATYRIERMNNELLVARREAEEARALKARFVATVSHELRGPLNLILGFSRLMALSPEKYGQPLPPAYRADVATIFRSSQHLLALVDDILDLSQIEAQRLPLVRDRVDLGADVIEKAAAIVGPLIERKGLQLRVEVAADLPWILADPVRLRQVLLNLLNNAIRFTERGSITIRAQRAEDAVVVSVADTGAGIPAEEMGRLFQEFRQVRAPGTAESTGTGLGLAICKYLVELHGGHIWAESQVGQGTTLYFTLPLPGTQEVSSTVRTAGGEKEARTYASCLVVHDDPAIVRLFARYIEGYPIVGVAGAAEATRLVEELHPCAILTTPQVAEEVLERLSQTPYDVPIITCNLPRIVEDLKVAGVLSYLIKPIAPEALTALMRRVERDGETTVLLVDDEPEAVRLLEQMLTTLPRPYRILKAYDGQQALTLMRETVPDVVFVDIVMPGLDGEETVARMREDERLRQVPVVFVSARDWLQDGVALHTPLSLRCREPVEIARGTRCLQALLQAVRPSYLGTPVPAEPSPGA